MVDIEAAMGYVVAYGDAVDRARLAWLRAGVAPSQEILDQVEEGQIGAGGWPALADSTMASIDATCFRLAELDDLGALDRPAARQAMGWLARRQRPDGLWEENAALAGVAPPWAQPGDDEATLYLTVNAAFWLAVSAPPPGVLSTWGIPAQENEYADAVARGADAFQASLGEDGSWPSYLATGWVGGALLYYLGRFYESAQIQIALAERVPEMSAADTARLAAAMRRVGMSQDDWLLTAARRRLAETQRSDGGWESDDGPAFDVHTTLIAIRGLRTAAPAPQH